MKNILDMEYEELRNDMVKSGLPGYRAEQVFSWIHKKYVFRIDDMANMSKKLKDDLNKEYRIDVLDNVDKVLSGNAHTEKYLWKTKDGRYIETVLIRSGKRRTLCVSTQIGCKFGCPFCSSGEKGFVRDLSSGEITAQALGVTVLSRQSITNIVFMGMGEPLDNFDNVARAIKIFNSEKGMNIGARHITVSTCGIIPGIKKLAGIGLQVTLSVSLHMADAAKRKSLVPADKAYPLRDLLKELKEYKAKTGRAITFEYTLFKGKNDSLEDARKLAETAYSIGAKVNIISYNNTASGFMASGRDTMESFVKELKKRGVNVTCRNSQGSDIGAACGQLAMRKKISPGHH